MSLRIDDFKSKLQGGGARPNLFKVILSNPSGVPAGIPLEEASFMTKGADLPTSVVEPIEVPFRGRQLKIAGDRTFENWTTTIINDNSFDIRTALENWMNSINSHVNNLAASVNPSDYQQDLIVQQLDHQFVPVKSYLIVGAFPVNLSAIELSYDSTNTVEEFTCEWAYQYWTSNSTDRNGKNPSDSNGIDFNASFNTNVNVGGVNIGIGGSI
jgi:hypothetical protein